MNVAAKHRQDQSGPAIGRIFQQRAYRVTTLTSTDQGQSFTAESRWSDIVNQWSIKIGAHETDALTLAQGYQFPTIEQMEPDDGRWRCSNEVIPNERLTYYLKNFIQAATLMYKIMRKATANVPLHHHDHAEETVLRYLEALAISRFLEMNVPLRIFGNF